MQIPRTWARVVLMLAVGTMVFPSLPSLFGLSSLRTLPSLSWLPSLSSDAAAQSDAVGRHLPAAVTVEVLDSYGVPVKQVNGTLVEDGVVVQTSALVGASQARVRTRGGDAWTVENIISASPIIGLSLLELPKDPGFEIPYPSSGAFRSDSPVTVLQGPAAGADSVSATLHFIFSLQDGTDYAPLMPPTTGAAPVFTADGRFLGVSVDLTAADIPVGVMVPMASVRTLSTGKGAPVPISATTTLGVPAFENVETETGLVFRGAALVVAGKTEDARNFLDAAIQRNPKSADGHFWKGRLLFVEQSHEEAAEQFVRAGEADPSRYMAWHMAGAAYNQAGNYLEAEKMYNKAIETNPRAADTWCNLGGAYFNQRRYEKAVDAFQKSIAINPRYSGGLAYTNLALTYVSLGKPEDAEKVYQDLQKIDSAAAARLRQVLDGRR